MPGEDIWAETSDGGLLKQLFGFYPTLRDATIRLIEIDRSGDQIAMTLDYRDMVGEDTSQNLRVTLRLEWRGISIFELPMDQTNLFGLDFERKADKLVTNLEVYPGLFGKIVSESVEATLVQVDPGESDEPVWIRLR